MDFSEQTAKMLFKAVKFIDDSNIVTIQNKLRDSSYISIWEITENSEKKEETIRCTKHEKIQESLISSYIFSNELKEVIYGTQDGYVNRYNYFDMKIIDKVKQADHRISHICYLCNKDDYVLAISSNSSYSTICLDGLSYRKTQEEITSSEGFFIEIENPSPKPSNKARIYNFLKKICKFNRKHYILLVIILLIAFLIFIYFLYF